MKKSLLTVAMVALGAFALEAQLLEVESMERVRMPEGVKAEQAMLSPDGSSIAFSDFDGTLKLMNRSDKHVGVISPKGSMMDLAFTPDSKTIVYREASYDASHKRMVSVNAYDITNRTNKTIAPASRNLQALHVRDFSAMTIDNGCAKVRAIAKSGEVKEWPVLSIERGLLYITENGERRLASPLGTSGMSYLWASISPDGSRMLFFAAGYGTYTCKLDGSDMHKLGFLYAPVWYDDNTVVGMKTKDDGVVTYEGHIIAADREGKVFQTLTEDTLVAVLPATAPGRISFTTTDGDMYIMNIKK